MTGRSMWWAPPSAYFLTLFLLIRFYLKCALEDGGSVQVPETCPRQVRSMQYRFVYRALGNRSLSFRTSRLPQRSVVLMCRCRSRAAATSLGRYVAGAADQRAGQGVHVLVG